MAAKKTTTARRTSSAKSTKNTGGKTAAAKRSAGSRSTAGKSTGRKQTKSTAARSRNTRKSSAPAADYTLFYEVILWCILAFAAFAFFSMFGFGGKAGAAIAAFCNGWFGIMGYTFPFLLFFITAFLIANSAKKLARVKTYGIVLMFLALCVFMQISLVGYSEGYTASQYYASGRDYHTGGGMIGGMIVSFFAKRIGIAGIWIVFLILMIVGLILLTQRSLIGGVKKGGRRIVTNAKEGYADRAAWRQERRQLREEARMREELEHPELTKERLYDPDSLEGFSILPSRRKLAAVQSEPAPKAAVERRRPEPKPGTGTQTEMRSAIDRIINDMPDDMPDPKELSEEPKAMELLRGNVLRGGGSAEKEKNEVPFVEDDIFRNAVHQTMPEPEIIDEEPEESIEPVSAPAPVVREKAEPKQGTPQPSAPEQAAQPKERAPRREHTPKEELQQEVDAVAAQIEAGEAKEKPEYQYPSVELLNKPPKGQSGVTEGDLRETAAKLQQVFQTFGVNVHITNVTCGPSVTRYELTPQMGVKVSKIVNLQDDIKLNLAAQDIRIEAPIPGKAAVGIEVPNKKTTGVMLRELLESEEFKSHPSKLAYAVGKDISGKIIVADIAKMPHLLIAGATGSGKSVFINTLIMSILYKASPEEVQMIMIDPKVVELSVYNGIPHLYIPVVTDPKKAAGALNWAVAEMMKRYEKFAAVGVRDLKGYNKRVESLGDVGEAEKPKKMPQIVIIVDELADLMMVASAEVEDAIVRLTQLARAAGIHLVIATQRPSVDVITGLIKANMPSRIAFSVSSGVDSRTILDSVGAEKLLGNGDMLFAPQTYKQPVRVQGAFVSDNEVADVAAFLKGQSDAESFSKEQEERMESVAKSASSSMLGDAGDVDELFADAGRLIIEKDKASKGMIQRYFKVGFNRAARIVDQLGDAGVIGPDEGTKPRKVLMSMEEFENYLEQN